MRLKGKATSDAFLAYCPHSDLPAAATATMETSIPKEQDQVPATESSTPSPIVDSPTTNHITHDSMVTVRLSEPPVLTVDTRVPTKQIGGTHTKVVEETPDTPGISLAGVEEDVLEEESPRITMMDPNGNELLSPSGSESAGSQDGESRRGSDSSEESVEGGGVNWEELEKTEENEPRDESSDDVSPSSHLSIGQELC